MTIIANDLTPPYVAGSDQNAMRFEGLQAELGVGPCITAHETGQAVLVADLARDERFSKYGPRALGEGLQAVFTFPLHHGATRLGALDLYRDTSGPLEADAVAVAQAGNVAARTARAAAGSPKGPATTRRTTSPSSDAVVGLIVIDYAGPHEHVGRDLPCLRQRHTGRARIPAVGPSSAAAGRVGAVRVALAGGIPFRVGCSSAGGWVMAPSGAIRAELGAVLAGAGGATGSADRLCHACVDLLEVDGAALSVVHDGAVHGTFGSSGEMSRWLDELQFTFGEGPCLDAVHQRRPVFVDDLASGEGQRWPGFSETVVKSGVRALAVFPVGVAGSAVGALDLFRNSAGALSELDLDGAWWAAELAALPLLSLIGEAIDQHTADGGGDGWSRLASFQRVEVYQATGVVMSQLNVGPAEALVRLRAHAWAHELSASEVARSIIEGERVLEADDGPADMDERPSL